MSNQPFGEESEEEVAPLKANSNLKKVSSKQSIFDSAKKKPSSQEFTEQVKGLEGKSASYKAKAAQLASDFVKILDDKTLPQNKNVFAKEIEKETIANMIQLATEINSDQYEQEGMGSLGWIVLLLKISLSQRDKINLLEYSLSELQTQVNNK